MKIGIDIRSTLKRKTGIGYYTVNLINYLSKADICNNYYLYSEIGLFNKDKKLPSLPGNNFRHRVNRLKLNPVFILSGLDIIHTQSYDLSCPKKSKLILVVHDVIHKAYPAGHALQTVRDVEQKMFLALERADRVIVSSLATRNDLMKFYRFDPDKMRLIYPGANSDLSLIPDISDGDKEVLKSKYKINSPFILYVGTLEPRKNVESLINAYRILKDDFKVRHQLVIAGMKGWMYEKIFSLVNEYQLQSGIVFTDYVSREDLNALYKMAEVFVYPSFYEGVGLPVLEAFNFGLPVVASRASSVGEIAADAAVLIDPYKPEEIVQAILTIIGDEKYKQDLIKKGFQRAKEFSWDEAARKTIGVFNEFA